MKISNNFVIQEVVDEATYNKYGVKSIWFMDDRIIQSVQTLRTALGVPLTINNWHRGGDREYSGLRPHDTTVGAGRSQHKFGRAIDTVSSKITAQEMRDYIMSNQDDFPFITTIEDKVGWLHMDCRNRDMSNGIMMFDPRGGGK